MSKDNLFDKVKTGVFILVIIIIMMYILTPGLYEKYILMNIPMYRLNCVKSMRFKDKKLNIMLNEIHSMLKVILTKGTAKMCKDKAVLVSAIKYYTQNMENTTLEQLNRMCEKNMTEKIKSKIRRQSGMTNPDFTISDDYGDGLNPDTTYINNNTLDVSRYNDTQLTPPKIQTPMNNINNYIDKTEVFKIYEKLFDLYAYAGVKFFCDGNKFNVKMLEEYLIAMLDDICSDNSNIYQMANVNSKFMVRKPLSYMNL